MSKDYFKDEYIKLRTKLGRKPKASEYYSLESIVKNQFVKTYGGDAFTKLQEDCGDSPNKLELERTDGEFILTQFGDLIKRLGKIPTQIEWVHFDCRPARLDRSPLGWKWKELPDRFIEFAKDKEGYKEVIQIIGESVDIDEIQKENKELKRIADLIRKWSPNRKRFTEETYKVELRGFLQANRVNVTEEKGESNIDLLVDELIGIEMKKDPSTSEYDRLLGQMVRHLMIYENLIVVVCDISSEDRYREFLKAVDFTFFPLGLNVEIIAK